jgi:hypothetical protein
MYEELLAILGVLGVGSLIATCLTYIFDKRKRIKFSEQEEKEKRYKSLVQKMRIVIQPEDMKYVKEHRPDLKNIEDWKKEIQQEWFNSLLFASDEVIRALKEFVLNPSDMTYAKTVLAMRKDLWNKKTKLKPEECVI